jgi:hypothetical protein
MKNLVLIIILILFIFGCRKKQYLTIRAINPVNNKAYPGLKYSIIQQKTGNNGTVSKTIARGVLGEDGMAKVDARILKTSPSVVIVDEPANTCFNRNITYTFGTNGSKNKEFLFEFVPCGDYQLQLNNLSCNGINDTIIWNTTNFTQTFLGIDVTLTGCVNQSYAISKAPIGEVYTKYKVKKLGVTNTYSTVFVILPNQLNVQVINY